MTIIKTMKSCVVGHSHSFDVGIAKKCGLNAAALYNHLFYWIRHNRIQGKNFIEGKTWTYQTLEEIEKYLPYLSYKQIRTSLDKLVDEGLVLKGKFNKTKMDQSTWYSLTNESLLNSLTSQNTENEPVAQTGKSKCRNGQQEMPDSADLSLYTNTSNKEEKEDIGATSETAVAVPTKSPSSLKRLKTLPKKVDRIDRAPNIATSDEEHQKLVAKYGLPLVEKCYLHLSGWKGSKIETDPKAVNKHIDYYRITTWVANVVKEEESKPTAKKSNQVAEEEVIARRLKMEDNIRRFHDYFKKNDLYVRDMVDHVKIGNDTIYYKDPKYPELVKHSWEKMRGSIRDQPIMNPTD